MIANTIFCTRCEGVPPHCEQEHLQSRKIRYQDITNIIPENTNNQGSSQCGNKWKCAISGATKPIIANNIGTPQQKI